MSAARLLASRRLRLTTIAAVAYTGSSHVNRRKTPLSLDGPGNATFAQDTQLVAYGRRAQSRIPDPKDSKHAAKRGDAELIDKTNDPDVYSPAFEDDDQSAWSNFSDNFNNVREGIARIEWGGIGDKISDFIMPSWARLIPDGIQKLQFEMSMEPGSLADEIWQEAHDPSINPEILWDAKVRIGNTLGVDELNFRRKRRERVVKALANYLDIDEADVDPDDVPTIAMCGSGGGFRALVAGTSSYLSAQEAGLFDCVTYTAGVSGSCWLQTLYFSSVGKQNHRTLLQHIKSRIGVHVAYPPPALKLVTSAPTNKFILSGFVEKLKGDPTATWGLVDIYGLLVAARLMIPKGDLDVQDSDLKMSNQRKFLEQGEHPMPIYMAVRHEIPVSKKEKEEAKEDQAVKEKLQERAQREAWFQWIEMHPWEVWCEEFGAGIPTWSLGRPFKAGRNQLLDTGIALPEVRQSLLLGIFGSAFTATLAHYIKEIRPVLKGIAGFGALDDLLQDKDDDLIKIHPIDPASIPNFVYDMKGQLPSTCPDSVFDTDHIQLMDAGMSNNLPIYPLLRPGRDVDILIAFDASADIQQENWLSVVDGYAKQRGIKSWPVGTGWPKASAKPQENASALASAHASTPKEAADRLAEAKRSHDQEDVQSNPNKTETNTETKTKAKTSDPKTLTESTKEAFSPDITHCNIWIGRTAERSSQTEPPASKRLAWDDPTDSTFALTRPDAGIAVIYFPLLPNPKVPGVDPDKSPYMWTFNSVYTPEQIDSVAALAKANFEEGADATKRTVRAVYERKKKLREDRESKMRIKGMKRKLREHADSFAGI